MNVDDLKTLKQNSKLKERIEQIISVPDLEKKYRMSQIILEYINVAFLTRNMKIEMEDYNIIRISEKYREIDENLFNEMLIINSLYNTLDQDGVNEDDIEYLLFKIDKIYEMIKTKYGELK